MQAPIVAGMLPLAYCYPASAQQLLTDFAKISYADVSDNVTGMTFGPTDPGPEGYLRPWFNTTTSKVYHWSTTFGKWVSLYWPPPSSAIRMFWENDGVLDDETALNAFENPGGAVVLGAELVTGPFWAIDHNYDGRVPVGPGTLTVIPRTINNGDTGGVDGLVQQEAQVARHRHLITIGPEAATDSYLPAEVHEAGGMRVKGGAEALTFEVTGNTVVAHTRQAGGAAGVVAAMDNMPPYRGAYMIKRTARAFYTL